MGAAAANGRVTACHLGPIPPNYLRRRLRGSQDGRIRLATATAISRGPT